MGFNFPVFSGVAASSSGGGVSSVNGQTGDVVLTSSDVGALSNLTTQNVVYVAKNGNDSTGLRNRLDKPFLTIQAAINAAQEGSLNTLGDLIYIYPGNYIENVINSKNGTSMYFSPNAVLSSPNANPTLRITNSGINIYGYLQIGGNASQQYTIGIENSGITIDCQYLRQNVFSYPSDFIRVSNGSSFSIYAKEMILYSNISLLSNNSFYLTCELLQQIGPTIRLLAGNNYVYTQVSRSLSGTGFIITEGGSGTIYVNGGFFNNEDADRNRPIVRHESGQYNVTFKDTTTSRYTFWNNNSGYTPNVYILGVVQERFDSTIQSAEPFTQLVGTIDVDANIPVNIF